MSGPSSRTTSIASRAFTRRYPTEARTLHHFHSLSLDCRTEPARLAPALFA